MSKLARAGEQTGDVQKKFSNRTPAAARRSRFGVSNPFAEGLVELEQPFPGQIGLGFEHLQAGPELNQLDGQTNVPGLRNHGLVAHHRLPLRLRQATVSTGLPAARIAAWI